MSSIIKNIFTILGLLLIVGLGVFLFMQNSTLDNSSNDTDISIQVTIQTQESLRRLEELKQIELSTDLFSDSRFTNLIDFSSEVSPLSFGRENPFQ